MKLKSDDDERTFWALGFIMMFMGALTGFNIATVPAFGALTGVVIGFILKGLLDYAFTGKWV